MYFSCVTKPNLIRQILNIYNEMLGQKQKTSKMCFRLFASSNRAEKNREVVSVV